MSDCVFCKIASNELPSYTIYEDDKFKVVLDRFPTAMGHTLILVKNHCTDLFDLPEEDAREVIVLAKKVAAALKMTLGCEGMNLVQNSGAAAGQTVSHFHMHLIPRNLNDGITNTWDTTDPTPEEFAGLLGKMKMSGLL